MEDKAKKSKLRSEKAARKKAVKDQLERLEKGEALADAPIVAPEKKSKRSTDKSKKKTTSSAVEPAANSNGKKGHPDDELDTAGDGAKPRRRKRQDPYKTSCNRKKKKKYSDDSDSGNESDDESEESGESVEVIEDELSSDDENDELPDHGDKELDNDSGEEMVVDDVPNEDGWIIDSRRKIPGFRGFPSLFKGQRFYHHLVKKRFVAKEIVYKRNESGAIGEPHYLCESTDSNKYSYFPTESLNSNDTVWSFMRDRWNKLAIGRVFRDDEDFTKMFYVTDCRYFPDRRLKCFHAVLYDGDEEKAKAMKDVADDDCVWDIDYVHQRIDAYDAEARPPATHATTSAPSESMIRSSVTQTSRSARSEPKSGPSKRIFTESKKASDRQLQLVDKAFTTDGKNKKLYLVAEVKYIEEYDQVCCCCVSNKTGNIDDMKLLAVDAKEKGVYGKNCVFDCTYVSRRVAHYDDEVRHR